MTETYKKKLIEVAIPLEAINAASAREKSIRHGHPSTLHLWWARRPLAACRAVLFAQLVDDPSSRVDELMADPKLRAQAQAELPLRLAAWEKSKASAQGAAANAPEPTLEDVAVEIERKRLFAIIEDLVKWEHSTNEEVLERARAEIRRSCGGELPPVYDPFSGGGSIPLEAQRLGLPAYGSDLNPVAVMIGKAMIEIPPKFKDMPPIHPGIKERSFYRNAEGLAEDVKYYGEWVRERAWERIGHLYPTIELSREFGGGQARVIAWIWARTVPSPDPAFSHFQVPLVSSFVLSAKASKEVWIEPLVDKISGCISYRIRKGGTKAELTRARQGTKSGRGNFICLLSGAAISADFVRSHAIEGRMGETLIAVVAEGNSGRAYASPNEVHTQISTSSECSVVADECRETFLSAATPEKLTGGTCYGYGLDTWGKIFTDRQLTALSTFSDLVSDVRPIIERDAQMALTDATGSGLWDRGAGAKAYAEAVSIYLAFLVGQLANHSSTICGWNSPNQQMRSTFSRQALPMTWDFAEVNPFSESSGSYHSLFTRQIKGFEVLGGERYTQTEIQQTDAQSAQYPDGVVVSTDPPYYDNIAYADLSDFFFVWMKKSLHKIYPELFGVIVTPKTEELVAVAYRHGNKIQAEQFFLEGMRAAIQKMAEASSASYPTAIYYAFKQSEIEQEGVASTGWATFVQSILDAGYSVVGTWPLRTEKPGRMVAVGTNALANSVVLVCRKREATADTITRAEFIRALKRELPPAIAELQAANIAPADMPQSAIGPGMGVFSRYYAVLEADDSPMTVKTALQLINAELDEYLGGIQGEFDADTRFAITWFEQNGMGKGEYGVADNLARARGISVDSVKHAGIAESAAGKVWLLKRDELDPDWAPEEDGHLTVWESLQHLVRLHEMQGLSHDTAALLKRFGPQAEAVKDLAYCLYDIAANKRREASEATVYNALIADWSELSQMAATVSLEDRNRQTRFEI